MVKCDQNIYLTTISSASRQKGLPTSHLYIQLDPFALKLMKCTSSNFTAIFIKSGAMETLIVRSHQLNQTALTHSLTYFTHPPSHPHTHTPFLSFIPVNTNTNSIFQTKAILQQRSDHIFQPLHYLMILIDIQEIRNIQAMLLTHPLSLLLSDIC